MPEHEIDMTMPLKIVGSNKTTKSAITILVILSVLLLARFLYFEYNLLNYPYQWSYTETLHLNHAIILSEGKKLYEISEEPPLVLEIYGPLTPALIAPLLKVFGKNLFTPRLVSLTGFLLLLLFVAYTVFSLTRSWQFALLSVGFNTLMASWWEWLLICRPDGIGNFLLFFTIFVHWKFPNKKSIIVLSLVTGIMGFFAKIYLVFGFGSIVLNYWFIQKDRKMAFIYLLLGSTVLGTSILIANHLTNNIYFMLTFELQPYWLIYSFHFLSGMLKPLLFYFSPLFAIVIFASYKGFIDYKRYGVFFTHLLLGFPLTSFLLLNTGAGTYYWYSIVPVLIIISCDLIYLESKKEHSRIILPVLIAMIMLIVVRVGYMDIIKDKFTIPTAALAQNWKPLEELIKNTPVPIMNDDGTAILNILAGKKLYQEGIGLMNPEITMHDEYGYSFIDIKKVVAQKKYALIISPHPNLKDEVNKHYNLYKTYNVVTQFGNEKHKIGVFVPKTGLSQTDKNISLQLR